MSNLNMKSLPSRELRSINYVTLRVVGENFPSRYYDLDEIKPLKEYLGKTIASTLSHIFDMSFEKLSIPLVDQAKLRFSSAESKLCYECSTDVDIVNALNLSNYLAGQYQLTNKLAAVDAKRLLDLMQEDSEIQSLGGEDVLHVYLVLQKA